MRQCDSLCVPCGVRSAPSPTCPFWCALPHSPRGPALDNRARQKPAITTVWVIELLGVVGDLLGFLGIEALILDGAQQRVADINQRFGERSKAEFLGGVQQGHFVVAINDAVLVPVEDGAVTDHAKIVQLRGPQGSHAGCPKNLHTFVHGVEHLRPLDLKTVAEAVGVHESTVSRVTSNKYMETPRGLFELKYFFTPAISAHDGSGAHSAESVRFRIKQMIDQEDPRQILSDDAIVTKLKGANIDVARRTVAKYREILKIPSSVKRRRRKRNS